MRPDDLKTFLHLHEQAGELVRIVADVDPRLELATIVDRLRASTGGGPTLLFEKLRGARLPVAANLFGTRERVGWAFGTTDLTALAERLAADLAAVGQGAPQQALCQVAGERCWQPVVAGRPGWLESREQGADLDDLPGIIAWPGDGGAFLTMAQVYTRHPDGGATNCGMYRVQRHGPRTATIRCRPGSGARRHLEAWHARGEAMPVAIALGGPPVVSWAAAAPLPEEVEELAVCGYLTGRPLVVSACRTCDLLVPESADIVIEGIIPPGAVRLEGPFGNHTGSYDSDPAAPEVRVLAVHLRDDAIYPWTLVGPPPRENAQLARATETLFMPMVRMALPTVRSVHMPTQGLFHRAALVSVEPAEERPLTVLAQRLRETLLLKDSRFLVIVGDDQDPRAADDVFWRVLNRVDWTRDLLADEVGVAVDARRRPAGEPVRCDPAMQARVMARWRQYGFSASAPGGSDR